MELRMALVQMEVVPMDPLRNLERMGKFVAEAKKAGAELVIFPEDAVCGPLQGQTAFVEHAPAYLAAAQGMAIRHQVDLVPGSWTVADNGLLFNQAHYITKDGVVAGTYRKINLWETEKVALTPGSGVSVFPTRFGQVGLIICWDISFPGMFAAMNELGVELVISPTYWSFPPKALGSEDRLDDEVALIDALCITRAFENNILLAYCNAAGSLDHGAASAVLSGRSQVTHPLEKVLGQCPDNAERVLVVDALLERTPLAEALPQA
ncbi:MAG TPA: carbon-nitrogen hydrolase family protein [Flavobacteriales bacterium]